MNRRLNLLSVLMRSGLLGRAHDFFGGLYDLLYLICSLETDANFPAPRYAALLKQQLAHVGRYCLALDRLAHRDEENDTIDFTIDGYYPILKSLFELHLEIELMVLYRQIYEPVMQDWDVDLLDMIKRFTDIQRKKNNNKVWYRHFEITDEMRRLASEKAYDFELPPLEKAYLEAGSDVARQELAERVRGMNAFAKGPSDINHWFPEKRISGSFYIDPEDKKQSKERRPRNMGSVQWRCQAVLGQHAKDKAGRRLWKVGFDGVYEHLNRYSHPVLGFDDNHRHDFERHADLFRMMWQLMLHMDQILKKLETDLMFSDGLPEDIRDHINELKKYSEETTSMGFKYFFKLDQTNPLNNPLFNL